MKVTIKQIAETAGVSVAAVSKALNGQKDISEKTRERIIKISKEMGYTPNAIARNLVKKGNNTVGVLIPDISTPNYPAIFKGINETAKKYGYMLLLGDTNRKLDNEKEYVKTLLENRVSGIIMSPSTSDIVHINEIIKEQIPIVYFGGKVNDTMKNYVGVDNVLGAKLATNHLVELGHKRIVMISDNSYTKTRYDRIQGYTSIMNKNGLETRLIINREGLRARECGYVTMKKIIESNETIPTAIFALNDLIAIGVMEALAEKEIKIPSDISIVGYDDISYSSLPMINLTTIWQPMLEIGKLSIELLHHLISNDEQEYINKKIVKPELVIRKSTTNMK